MTKLKLRPDSLILVADGAKALFLRNAGDELYPNLIVAQTFKNDNPPTRDQGTDRPGRVHESATARRSGVEVTDWHVVEEQRFVETTAASLNTYVENDGIRSVVIVAPPRVIGSLREALPEGVRKLIVAEIDKDLTNQPTYEIEKYLKDYQTEG
ncbi:Protein required for attachment to host cells OS=Afipia felis OX=1035 GN=NCTC12722_03730 PE=4 SV=1 [Afipia felis]